MSESASNAEGAELTRFAAELPFALDDFQRRGCEALQQGRGVLVCAPTGAGKTVVGEFAVHLALAGGGKCFYTTPIKALSNQKYTDLVARYGKDQVGLLTGDLSVNAAASVVVMTTEVLRNMLYADSPALHGLSHVVMDEVHFLADRMRGAVWEEVILHLPEQVRLVSLSATVSNAEEFGGWIQTVRGDTAVVVDEHRPVPLWQHMMVGKRLFDLFESASTNSGHDAGPRVDPHLVRHIAHRREADRLTDWSGSRRPGHKGAGRSGRPSYRPPMRPDVIAALDAAGLLPVITFVFSRAGCDAAVKQCLRSPLRLTTEAERARIAEVIDHRCGDLADADLDVLGYYEWREALLRGLAAHHAGMLPVFRHTVEELFSAGLVKAVFATETLALGINMPARTVVLERLVKFNGEQHAALTPGEYTQLTGRAGRRGIDVEGHAVVLWHPTESTAEPDQVAGLASTRTFPLRSSFAPSYNMTINLVQHTGSQQAHRLLEQSFAQYQADRSVVGLVRSVEHGQRALQEIADELGGSDAQVLDYARLRAQISERERAHARASRLARRKAAGTALAALRRGDIITLTHGRHGGLAVVLQDDRESDEPRPLVLTEHRWAGRISTADYSATTGPIGTMSLPKRVEHRQPRVRRDVASALRSVAAGFVPPEAKVRHRRRDDQDAADPELAGLRQRMLAHPAHAAPDREAQVRLAERYLRLEADNARLRAKVEAATNSLARTFDRIVGLLMERGFIRPGDGASSQPRDPQVTDDGRMLARIYSESDLLVAECLRTAAWQGLGPAELAAVVSVVLYETRGSQDFSGTHGSASVPAPTERVRRAVQKTQKLSAAIRADERRYGITASREPDDGFVAAVYRWARTGDLASALAAADQAGGSPLSAGDFVRWCRQVLDLLDQLRNAAPDADLRVTAKQAIDTVLRGVVAVDAG